MLGPKTGSNDWALLAQRSEEIGQLIKAYMELTGCTRHHAAWLLRCWATTVWTRQHGRPVKIVVGQRRARRRTPRAYDQEVVAALIKLWQHFGYPCGKRLATTLRLRLPNYERWDTRSKRKIALTPELRADLVRISPATIDRLLRTEKPKLTLRGHSHTWRPTGSLMLPIPIRTFSECGVSRSAPWVLIWWASTAAPRPVSCLHAA